MKKLLLALTAATLLSASAYAADVKTYQVTGPVLALDDSSITVQKGSEKWQIAKGSASIPAGTKVGDKVTVQYSMTATAVTAKAAKK